MKTVLIFSGRLGSGKSAVSKAVAERLNFGWNGFSSTLRRIAANQGSGEARTDLQELGEELVTTRAEEFCRRVVEEAIGTSSSVVIDGLRHESMKALLQSVIGVGQIIYIYVECSEQIRLSRLAKRDGLDFEQIAALESHSTERDVVEQLRLTADLVIDNSGELEDAISQTIAGVSNLVTRQVPKPHPLG